MATGAIAPDIWVLIGLHLKPRYLAKLMQTSKVIKKVVDNENYWTRVAAHTIWRDQDCMEVFNFKQSHDVLPRIEHNLYYMLGLDHGYFWGMERFFQRLDEVILHYSENDITEEYCAWWISLQGMPLKERTLEFMRSDVMTFGTKPPYNTSMKELAKEKTTRNLSKSRVINKFMCEMEDDPMPNKYKRHFFSKLDTVLWNSKDSYDNDYSELAFDLCKF